MSINLQDSVLRMENSITGKTNTFKLHLGETRQAIQFERKGKKVPLSVDLNAFTRLGTQTRNLADHLNRLDRRAKDVDPEDISGGVTLSIGGLRALIRTGPNVIIELRSREAAPFLCMAIDDFTNLHRTVVSLTDSYGAK